MKEIKYMTSITYQLIYFIILYSSTLILYFLLSIINISIR